MNNIHLHIIGSKTFFNFLKELDLDFFVSSDEKLINDDNRNYVRVVFPQQLKLNQVNKYCLENVPTIFFLENKDYLKENRIQLLQFHVPLTVPVEFLSFREILNILITKYNFFKKSKIVINGYEIDSNQKIIVKNSIRTKLTEKELELILVLNKNNGLNKPSLLKEIWNHNSDLESHAFETHLHRLRKKIKKYFRDNKFITEKNSHYYLSK
jgi:DNA-binding response OmpR family regulator